MAPLLRSLLFLAVVLRVASFHIVAPPAKASVCGSANIASCRAAIIRMEDEEPDPSAVIDDAVGKMKKTISNVQ